MIVYFTLRCICMSYLTFYEHKRSIYIFGVTNLLFVFPGSAYLLISF